MWRTFAFKFYIMLLRKQLFLLPVLLLWQLLSMGQCVVINEILINGPGSCDGNCSPSTEEWIELYNTCNTPADVSCFVFSDGDFTVTIPSGTIIPPYGYLTIGSDNSGFIPDVNLSNCNCTGGSSSNVGVFTNGSEQGILLSNTGSLVNGVVWGGGQFPVNITSPTTGGCAGVNFNFTNGNALESLPSGGGQGETLARQCDGSSTWVTLTPGNETPGASNGESVQIDFDASASIICPGNCIDFSDLSVGNVTSWTWSFEGAGTTSSSQQNPTGICYPMAGNYDVTLAITSSCGNTSLTMPDFIQVGSNLNPSISAQGSTNLCANGTVVLQTSSTGSLQWLFNGNPIPGATNSTYSATQVGDYSLEVNQNGCVGESNIISITSSFSPTISLAGDAELCEGETTTLQTNDLGTYQWYLGTTLLIGETNATLTVDASGNYTCQILQNGCNGTSNAIAIAVLPLPNGSISTPDSELCPQESTVLTLTGTYANHTWRNDSGLLAETSNQLNVSAAGNYYVTLYNSAGCEVNTNSITITEISVVSPNITSSNGNSLCPNESSVLSISAIYNQYAWFEGTTDLNEFSNIITIDSPGNYTVSVTTIEGCQVDDDITITASAVPDATLSSSTSLPTCNDFATLIGSAPGVYEWYYENNLLFGENGSSIDATDAGSYYFIVTASSGCSAQSEPIEVSFLEGITVEINTSTPTACQGETVTLFATDTYTTYLWSTAENSAMIGITQDGEYTIEVTDDQGCVGRDTLNYTFNPLPEITTEPTVQSDCVDGAIIEAIGEGNITWEENEFIAHGSTAIALVNPTATTTFTAIAELNGCFSYSNTMVTVDCSSIYAPNAFSPNGDGINDVFEIKGTGIIDYELTIFDKWGGIIFQSIDPTQAWTGGIEGYFVPDGVYNYTLKALDVNGVPLIGNGLYFGSVLVIR